MEMSQYCKRMALFVMPYANIDAVAFQFSGKPGDIGLSIMVWEQHLGFDDPGHTRELFGGHGVRLVARQKGDVNIFDVSHFGDVLSVAGDVNPHTVNGKDEAVVASLGMKLQMSFGDIVGWDGFHREPVIEDKTVAVGHDFAVAQDVGATSVGDQFGLCL